jgi:hypothetical protein
MSEQNAKDTAAKSGGNSAGGGKFGSGQSGKAGWPAKTGNKSGKGRDNNPPKK